VRRFADSRTWSEIVFDFDISDKMTSDDAVAMVKEFSTALFLLDLAVAATVWQFSLHWK
jgi:hypothetical protein